MPADSENNIVHTFDDATPVVASTTPAPSPKRMPTRKPPTKLLKVLGGVGIAVVLVFVVLALLLVVPIQTTISSTKKLIASAQEAKTIAQSQDLGAMQKQVAVIQSNLAEVRKNYSRMAWLKIIPIARNYYLDGERGLKAGGYSLDAGEITINALAPYADVIGLKGIAGTGDGAKTAQDRINFIVETLDKLKPELSSIGEKLELASKEVDQIDPNRYPEQFQGIALRSQLTAGIQLLDQATSLINDAQPLLESAPYMLGRDKPRKYLVLFQNDAELRPTGGFMTGYAIIEVNKGKISTLESDDIYKLDEKFPKKITAPQAILKYMPNVPYWYLRDQNLSPDFKVSMDTFYPNYLLTKSPVVDGIIAVDTQLLVNLLKVTGPIGIPGYGNFSADNDPRCNCPNVFYQLQVLAGGEEPVIWDPLTGKIIKAPADYGVRKRFLGPVMYSILANVMAQPKSKIPTLFNTGLEAIQSKHIMFYYTDATVQAAMESFNMAGRVREVPNEDYLMVVDTNFSGAKTNIWVKYEASQDIQISGDGTVTKTVTLTYTNPQDSSVKVATGRTLNGLFRDWLRVYVPKGSKLVEAKGFETGQATGEDLGKTVFEGFFTLAPLNVRTISIKYTLPFKMKSPYKMVIQKQGGAKDFIYKTKINGKAQPETILNGDKEVVVNF